MKKFKRLSALVLSAAMLLSIAAVPASAVTVAIDGYRFTFNGFNDPKSTNLARKDDNDQNYYLSIIYPSSTGSQYWYGCKPHRNINDNIGRYQLFNGYFTGRKFSYANRVNKNDSIKLTIQYDDRSPNIKGTYLNGRFCP